MLFKKVSKDILTQGPEQNLVLQILRLCRSQNFIQLGLVLSKWGSTIFPRHICINQELGFFQYYSNEKHSCYHTFKNILDTSVLDFGSSRSIIFNQHFSIDGISNDWIYRNPQIIYGILNRPPRKFPLITVTITSCKRYDLFRQTLNSFINCCVDLDKIDRWICIDDNSSDGDRDLMKTQYPFIEFYFKTPWEKGHPQSMNILRKMVTTPYVFHLEDDWKFIERRSYMSECLDVLSHDTKLGQCLINKNYAEIAQDHSILGGLFRTTKNGLRYYIHEYAATPQDKNDFYKKWGPGSSCSYWPHFSFRPSLLKTQIWRELGEFGEDISHFEMDYSYRYIGRGWKSAFLESIYCIHTGRLTSEINNPDKLNAYALKWRMSIFWKRRSPLPLPPAPWAPGPFTNPRDPRGPIYSDKYG